MRRAARRLGLAACVAIVAAATAATATQPDLAARLRGAIERHLEAEAGVSAADVSVPDLAAFVADVPDPDAPLEIEVRGAPRPGAASRAAITLVLRRGARELRRGVVTVGLVGAAARATDAAPRAPAPVASGAALVERGAVVRLRVAQGPLRLEARGKARDDGRLGDTVRVINLDSRREVLGRVAADGAVDVEP